MAHYKLKKGLDLPLAGSPKGTVHDAPLPSRVALLGRDYPGIRPKLLLAEGDPVRRGQAVWVDKKQESLVVTAPGAGVIQAVNRGERRSLLSVVIRLDKREETDATAPLSREAVAGLPAEEIRSRLLSSGAWTSLRRRPYGTIPSAQENPSALFVTAMDTQPLAPPMTAIMAERSEHLDVGLTVFRRLCSGPIHFCSGPDWNFPLPDLPGLLQSTFSGPHPAGNAGTHIHFLHPADKNRPVWHIDLQDLLAVGQLFVSGVWPVERIVALGGPGVKAPRLLRTRLGADLDEILRDELRPGDWRTVSGSALSGHTAFAAENFLGRRHQQISVLAEDLHRSFLGWANPFPRRLFSLKRVVLGAWFPRRPRTMTTSRNGGVRAMIPSDVYERVMPLDLMPTFLLRSLLSGDVEEAEALGCLELVEEDLALCTFVCPSKIEYGPLLRQMLDLIEKEG